MTNDSDTGWGGAGQPDEGDGYFSDTSATLGDRIAAARLEAALTQGGLAARLGVSEEVIASWENDRAEPRANRLAMLAGLLNVSVRWLLTGDGDGVTPPDVTAAPAEAVANAAAVTIFTPVDDLDAAKRFYGDCLGCALLDSAEGAQKFQFFGHELEARLAPAEAELNPEEAAPVSNALWGGDRFVGLELGWDDWSALTDRLRAEGIGFRVEPAIRHLGLPDEHGAFMLEDPFGNLFEFRAKRPAGGV